MTSATYAERYTADYGFEARLVEQRRRSTIAALRRLAPSRVLEVGCGLQTLAVDAVERVPGLRRWVVVEPSPVFAAGARDATWQLPGVDVVTCALQELPATPDGFDVVVVDALLHEIADDTGFVATAAEHLADRGELYVSVPNATSLHRRAAMRLGLLDRLATLSPRARGLGQHRVYTRDQLDAVLATAGLVVTAAGGHALKPASNEQMARIEEVLGRDVVEAIMVVGDEAPDLAAELWATARRA